MERPFPDYPLLMFVVIIEDGRTINARKALKH